MPPSPNPDTQPRIRKGTCSAVFAYDIGFAIDLAAAERHIARGAHRESIKRTRRSPASFESSAAPLRVTQAGPAIVLGTAGGPFETDGGAGVDLVLYDFGAVSVVYEVPLAGPLDRLVDLSDALYDNAALLDDSRRRVEGLLGSLGPAVTGPSIAGFVEDYFIFQIEDVEDPRGDASRGEEQESAVPFDPAVLVERHAQTLAQVLRSEREPLAAQEVADALSSRIAYGPADLALIDFNAALLFMREGGDVRTVLEFANVELLEMRFLDDCLDEAMDRAYEAVARVGWRGRIAGTAGGAMARVARLQIDGAILFEGVNNALKLIGDQYLARVYRLAAARLHLPDWDVSILRKLDSLESSYQKLSDRASARRMELLEWIVIVLIAMELVIGLAPWFRAR